MIALATCSLLGLMALNAAITAALLARLRTVQRHVEAQGGLPDPHLPPPGTRIGAFQLPLAAGPAGELSDRALQAGSALVGLFTTGCLQCEAVIEELEAAPPGIALVALIHVEPGTSSAAVDRLTRRTSQLGRVAQLDAQARAAFGHGEDSGFPTLFRLDRGVVVAAGHRVSELALTPGG